VDQDNLAARLALDHALRALLSLPTEEEQKAGPAGGDTLVVRLIRSAASFVEALDRVRPREILRTRAGMLDRETASDTRYDQARRRFIRLFDSEEDLPPDPPEEDFGILNDEYHSCIDFPSWLQMTKERTATYQAMVPLLRATRLFEARPVGWPVPGIEQPTPQDGSESCVGGQVRMSVRGHEVLRAPADRFV
jgi:hypothetical protein